MTSNRDYEIPIRILEPMSFDAAEGCSLEPGEVGGLVRDERLLPTMVENAQVVVKSPIQSPADPEAITGVGLLPK